MLKKYYAVFGPALRVLDALILSGSWMLAYYFRKHFPLSIMHTALPPFKEYRAYAIVIIFLWATVFSIADLYSSKRMTRRTVEAYKVLRAHWFALLVFIALTYLVSTYKLSRGVFLYFFVMSTTLIVGCRLALRNLLRKLRARGFNLQKVMIVGVGPAAQHTYEKLKRHPELGLDIIGFVAGPYDKVEEKIFGKPVLGTIAEITDLIRKHGATKIVVALSRSEGALLEKVLERVKEEFVDLTLVPDIYDYVALGCEVEDFDGLPMVSLNETPIMGLNLFLKRIFDVFIAAVALLIWSPVMVILSVIIKSTSKGPVFYKQERMSLNGKSFSMLKFRSMRMDQSGDVEILTKQGDPRVTAIGRFIRKTSLDELPQFFNVLKGEMSIVGPRPERTWVVEEVRSQIPKYMFKHKVKAGITGWAQINGWRGNTSLEKRIEYDLYYIKNWSLLFDLKIIFLTLFKGLVNRNAY